MTRRAALFCCLLFLPLPAGAQQVIQSSVGNIQIGQTQLKMLEAAKKVSQREFNDAIQIYTKVLTDDPAYVEAWLQRGVVRRENGDPRGAQQDGTVVVQLATQGLQLQSGSAKLYQQRAMGYRLLGQYDNAKNDIRQAAQLEPNRTNWQAEMQATVLEEKLASQR